MQVHAGEQASAYFSQHVLEHRLVQTQVRNQTLQIAVLLLENLQPTDLGNAETTELLLPPVGGRTGHTLNQRFRSHSRSSHLHR